MTMAANNWMYVTAAFVSTWIALAGYAIRVHVALSHARAEHDAVANNEGAQ